MEDEKRIIRRIDTARLGLFPLDKPLLRLAASDIAEVCRLIGLNAGENYGFFETRRRHRVYNAKLDIMEEYPRAWLITTAWYIGRLADMSMIGEVGFKGPPNLGEIEIGYGLKPGARNCGYMTEAVETMCVIAAAQKDYKVEAVMAKTLPNNLPSHNVLRKNGFVRDGVSGKYWRWVKTIKPFAEE